MKLAYCFTLIGAMPAFAASSSPGLSSQGPLPIHISSVVKTDAKTGRLVRKIIAPHFVAAGLATPPPPLLHLIDGIASEQGVEKHLVHSVIRVESNYDPYAVSPRGASGIMQLIPATARRFGVSDVFDPADNIRGGVKYLRFLLDYYQGDYARAIAAYNAGEGAVDKYRGIPPFPETVSYVDQVARNLESARQFAASASSPAPPLDSPADTKIETTRPIETSTGSDGRVYYRTP